jgi:hypothetical protein
VNITKSITLLMSAMMSVSAGVMLVLVMDQALDKPWAITAQVVDD